MLNKMSLQLNIHQKLFSKYYKNLLLIILIITTIVTTISTSDEREKCFFRRGRQLSAGYCIPTVDEDKCCRDQNFAVGVCPDSRDICCFDYNSNCDNESKRTESEKLSKLLLSRIVRQTRHGEKARKFRTNYHIVEMPEHMQTDAINLAFEALEQYIDDYNEAADYLCRMLEKKYHDSWSCVIGTNFGFSVEPETGKYMLFYIGNINRIRVMAFVAKSNS